MQVERIGVPMGAVVTGVDLRNPVDAATAGQLRNALYEHQALVFPDQHLDRDQHVAAAAIFGRPDVPQPHKFLGRTDPVHMFVRDERHLQTAEEWHTDVPFMEEPPICGTLSALQVPRLGGDTAAWQPR